MWRTSSAFDDGRRTFLASLLALVAGVCVSSEGNGAREARRSPVRNKASIGIEGIVGDPMTARHIGRLYLEANPDEADREKLRVGLRDILELEDPKAARRRITETRGREFAHEDIVMVRGWVLARTEARICALMFVS